MNYIDVCTQEGSGTLGEFGLTIRLSIPGGRALADLTKEERRVIRRAADDIEAAVLEESTRRDPDAKLRAEVQRFDLTGLFPWPIFVEEIPNGYCSQWCCKHLPWFVVTTTRGRITLGWRKRVIEIRWDACVADTAANLFPAEDVTKGERLIHAWTLDKAREYIAKLLSGPTGTPGAEGQPT